MKLTENRALIKPGNHEQPAFSGSRGHGEAHPSPLAGWLAGTGTVPRGSYLHKLHVAQDVH